MTAVTVPRTRAVRPTSSSRSGPRRALRHALTVSHRHLIQLTRSPELLVSIAVEPIIFLVLFNYVFGGAIAAPGEGYIDFLVPGIIVQLVAFATVQTGLGLNQDVSKGIVDRFRSLPMARSAVLSGRILADAARFAFDFLLLAGVGALMGFRIATGPVPALGAFLLTIAFGVALAWVAAWIGLAVRSPEAVQSAGFLWLFPLTFASSVYVPAQTMPGWLQAFVKANPVTVTVDALRALLLGGPTTALVLQSLAWTAAILAVFSTLAVRQYRRIT
ncbi:MAG: ABC transporter permease [Egibacteraceae bacterium]